MLCDFGKYQRNSFLIITDSLFLLQFLYAFLKYSSIELFSLVILLLSKSFKYFIISIYLKFSKKKLIFSHFFRRWIPLFKLLFVISMVLTNYKNSVFVNKANFFVEENYKFRFISSCVMRKWLQNSAFASKNFLNKSFDTYSPDFRIPNVKEKSSDF